MSARIFRPAPNAMQQGAGNSRRWVLVNEEASPREIEPLMGYTSSGDTGTQTRLYFDTLAEAEAFAQNLGVPYRVQMPNETTVKRSVYPDNFKFNRKEPWTH